MMMMTHIFICMLISYYYIIYIYNIFAVTVVKKTWGKETENIEFFSDVSDPSIPTVTLGIPNTERG